jgi:hypothetical protein
MSLPAGQRLAAAAAVNGSNRIAGGGKWIWTWDLFLIRVSVFRLDNGFTVVSWAYGRTARFSYLAVSCAYTHGPWRSRAVVGRALGPGAP